MPRKITIKSPATIANLVCGFDILGLALEEPYDLMTLEFSDEPGLKIKHVDAYNLPENPEDNVAGAALLSLMEAYKQPLGFTLTIDKIIKPGSGLGSSAASAAGGVFAANKLLNNAFTNDELIKFAMNGEKVASGVKHADNITPCLLGGVTLIRSIHPLDVIKLNAPELFITVVHPQIEVKTSDARQILKEEVQLKKAIKQWGNIAGLVAGLMHLDFPVTKIAYALGVTRQTVYNWFEGKDVFGAYQNRVELLTKIMSTSATADEAWRRICKEYNLKP